MQYIYFVAMLYSTNKSHGWFIKFSNTVGQQSFVKLCFYAQETSECIKIAFSFTTMNNQLNFLSRCLLKDQHVLLKRDMCFHWKFNAEDSNYESAQLSKMAERGSAFLAIARYTYAKRRHCDEML